MFLNKQIAAVVPAFDEEELIGRVIETTPPFVDRIIVVDDASKDKTAGKVKEHRARDPGRIVLLEHSINQGVGGAIATGYKWCRDNNIDVAVVMAGDAQMDPNDLPHVLEPVVTDRADYVKGNRLFTGDAWNQIPKIRYLGNAGLSLLTKIASGYWRVADSQCGYTAINLKALKTIDWDSMYKRYGQPNDLLVRLNVYNFRVCDVPVKPIYHVQGKSGLNPLRMIPKLMWLVFQLFFYRMIQKYVIRDFHPLVFFYALGSLLLSVFLPLLAVRLFALWMVEGSIPRITALAIIVVVVSGLQLLLFAMWFDMEYNRHLCSVA
jgi:glycosyltransferase involved in cell wall biosynthesis